MNPRCSFSSMPSRNFKNLSLDISFSSKIHPNSATSKFGGIRRIFSDSGEPISYQTPDPHFPVESHTLSRSHSTMNLDDFNSFPLPRHQVEQNSMIDNMMYLNNPVSHFYNPSPTPAMEVPGVPPIDFFTSLNTSTSPPTSSDTESPRSFDDSTIKANCFGTSPALSCEDENFISSSDTFPNFDDSQHNLHAHQNLFDKPSLPSGKNDSTTSMITRNTLELNSLEACKSLYLSLDQPSSARHTPGNPFKPRRRRSTLPPIEVDPDDKVALKRARNTLAARESRQRKLNHLKFLETRIAELEAENFRWKSLATQNGFAGLV